MDLKQEIFDIEFRLKKIFEKTNITRFDVNIANELFYKWKKLTEYKEKYEYPIIDDILDKEPICKN